MSKDEKIDKIYDMLSDLTKDVAQTKLIAHTASATAEKAMEAVREVRDTVKQVEASNTALQRDVQDIKNKLHQDMEYPQITKVYDDRAKQDMLSDLITEAGKAVLELHPDETKISHNGNRPPRGMHAPDSVTVHDMTIE
ncbi:unnamed protein product, partial [Prorocentrum cordatum]